MQQPSHIRLVALLMTRRHKSSILPQQRNHERYQNIAQKVMNDTAVLLVALQAYATEIFLICWGAWLGTCSLTGLCIYPQY